MRADSKDNGVSRLDFIEVFRQLNELSFAERSPLGSIENQHDIAPDLILKTILRAVDEGQSEVVRHFSNLDTQANRNGGRLNDDHNWLWCGRGRRWNRGVGWRRFKSHRGCKQWARRRFRRWPDLRLRNHRGNGDGN